MYQDAKFYTRVFVPHAFAADFGTANATTVAVTDAAKALGKFKRRTKISAVRLRCTTIPNASATALVASFLNGTDTFATVTLTTATADQHLDGSVTAAYAILAADAQPTVSIAGTATASGDSLGDYDVWFEQTELYS